MSLLRWTDIDCSQVVPWKPQRTHWESKTKQQLCYCSWRHFAFFLRGFLNLILLFYLDDWEHLLACVTLIFFNMNQSKLWLLYKLILMILMADGSSEMFSPCFSWRFLPSFLYSDRWEFFALTDVTQLLIISHSPHTLLLSLTEIQQPSFLHPIFFCSISPHFQTWRLSFLCFIATMEWKRRH